MKRINVDTTSSDNRRPFWMPWGLGGAIWRYIAFIVALLLYLLLLKFLLGLDYSHTQKRFNGNDNNIKREVFEPTQKEIDNDVFLREVINGRDPINDRNLRHPGRELPKPDRNRLNKPNDDEIINDPDNPYKKIVGTRLNIILNSDSDDDTFNRFGEEFKQLYPEDDYQINYYNNMTKMMQITIPEEMRQEVKQNLPKQITDIDFKIFEEEIMEGAKAKKPNDPAFKNADQSWHFEPIQAYEAWEITKGSPDVVVAIIDSYIDVQHEELKGRITKPYSVERQSKNVLPPAGPYTAEDGVVYHGSHVAGLAVGALNNGKGAAGIAPECTLMPISLGTHMSSMTILEALLYAINQGADVINLSIQQMYPDELQLIPIEEQLNMIEPTEQEEIWDYVFKLANERNCLIVWAAGNKNVVAGLDDKKRNNSTLKVSAVDPNLHKADFSNYGNFEDVGIDINYSDISAPGTEIYSSVPGNNYMFCPGTSMSAPIVTGAVALMKSLNPDLTNEEVITILKETAKPLDSEEYIGPLLQIKDALLMVKGEVANFDEIIEDPNELVGTWKTTEELYVHDADTGEFTGEMTHIYLEFTSPEEGIIRYEKDNGHKHKAPIKVHFEEGRIVVEQTELTQSPTDPVPFSMETRIGERGKNGDLIFHNEETPENEYKLIKVK